MFTLSIHYYKKDFARPLEIGLRGEQDFQPPRLIPSINRGGHFLLTEVVTKTTSQNRLTEADTLKCPPRLILINRGGCYNANASVNDLTETGNVTKPPRL